jgi:hypothetical protein
MLNGLFFNMWCLINMLDMINCPILELNSGRLIGSIIGGVNRLSKGEETMGDEKKIAPPPPPQADPIRFCEP